MQESCSLLVLWVTASILCIAHGHSLLSVSLHPHCLRDLFCCKFGLLTSSQAGWVKCLQKLLHIGPFRFKQVMMGCDALKWSAFSCRKQLVQNPRADKCKHLHISCCQLLTCLSPFMSFHVHETNAKLAHAHSDSLNSVLCRLIHCAGSTVLCGNRDPTVRWPRSGRSSVLVLMFVTILSGLALFLGILLCKLCLQP